MTEEITIKQYIDTCMEGVNTRLENIEGKLDSFIEKADQRYAPKWVESAITWSAGILIVTLLGAVAYFIDRNGL